MAEQIITSLELTKETHPKEILRRAFERFENVAISFSGAEDVVLIDLALQVTDAVNVFALDTGRLHPETYRFIEKTREHYGIDIEMLSPDKDLLDEFVKRKGLFSFYADGHTECCAVRKVDALRRKLATLDAWVTGQRMDQSPSTRNDLKLFHVDQAFSSDDRNLYKFNPLTHWSSRQVWDYIIANKVPYNPLHEKGYLSIGCEPCTRPVRPNQHERAGRWWWEEATMKECGLHTSK